jgi:hypothetical protein
VGLKAISTDGLEFLEDSLKELSLRENRLRSIPAAVWNLHNLEWLDMTDNEITQIPDDMARSMESGLRSLSTLTLNSEYQVSSCFCLITHVPLCQQSIARVVSVPVHLWTGSAHMPSVVSRASIRFDYEDGMFPQLPLRTFVKAFPLHQMCT